MDLRDQLVRIDTPTLWLFGENDPLIPQNVIQDLTDLQPNAEITTLSGAAHMPFASHPQQTADAIVQFIQVITQKTGLAVV
jgi:pimeloyl-[acyl-carrier protein] methyl ester esterase